MFLIGIRVRPSSTVSWTGMSRIMLMSLPAVEPVVGAKLANDAGETCSAASWTSEAVSAPAHSAAAASAGDAPEGLSVDMVLSEPAFSRAGEQLIDLERVLAVRGSVVAGEHRNAGDLGLDRLVQVELDEVARLQREQLLDRRRRLRELGDELDLGGLDLLRHQLHPALVGRGRAAVHRRVEDVADRLERRVGNAEVDRPSGVADLERERRRDDDLGRLRDVRELRLHPRAPVIELERIDAV